MQPVTSVRGWAAAVSLQTPPDAPGATPESGHPPPPARWARRPGTRSVSGRRRTWPAAAAPASLARPGSGLGDGRTWPALKLPGDRPRPAWSRPCRWQSVRQPTAPSRARSPQWSPAARPASRLSGPWRRPPSCPVTGDTHCWSPTVTADHRQSLLVTDSHCWSPPVTAVTDTANYRQSLLTTASHCCHRHCRLQAVTDGQWSPTVTAATYTTLQRQTLLVTDGHCKPITVTAGHSHRQSLLVTSLFVTDNHSWSAQKQIISEPTSYVYRHKQYKRPVVKMLADYNSKLLII